MLIAGKTFGTMGRAFLHDVTAAMLVFQYSPVGVEVFSYVSAFFCSNKSA